MPALEQLSRLGFGGYRVRLGVREHEEALRCALSAGCNLIDTAASYEEGASEALIGKVLHEYAGERPFVITKAGYADSGHSISPDFLRARLERSFARLQVERVGAFLLHNPEHVLETDPDGFYEQMRHAFEFLEDQVERGVIGCYGISSSTLPGATAAPTTPDLHRLLDIARRVAPEPSFRIVQFPFNLLEEEALTAHHGEISLVELARSAGLRLVGHRPLNASTGTTALRLGSTREDLPAIDDAAAACTIDAALDLISERLAAVAPSRDAKEVPIVRYLARHWADLPNPEAVDALVRGHIAPLLAPLYRGEPPPEHREVITAFVAALHLRARWNQCRAAESFRAHLVAEGRLDREDARPLALIACEHALTVVDHVLVGMRRRRYVEMLRPLLAPVPVPLR